ncbi:MAG: Nif3-like dinuclear metal center hexameric protein [Chitinophagales bacterium]|nr:Nif3-like dinuclear metal center hexameric protein [Chitinophagales bacterium]MDW8274663.1 Nif3-like dinuclear metal center hexameric protein [Chitinophagales bacterium]
MILSQIINEIEKSFPLSLQENYDNCGLLVGDPKQEISAVLLTLDCTEQVIEEAISVSANLIIAHHPIIFSGLKKITGSTYVERAVIKAIKNNIAIYAIHTNLDNIYTGVNAEISKRLGLRNCSILLPKKGMLRKLVTFIPEASFESVSQAVFDAGAGFIGNYSDCGFSVSGIGTFRGNEQSNPAIGQRGLKEKVGEMRFETIYPVYLENKILSALFESHPYEEVAYDIYPLDNIFSRTGSGMIGDLSEPMEEKAFLAFLKKSMQATCIRHTQLRNKPVCKVAVCGGSGSFLLHKAILAGADVYISADFKYHEFFDADGRIVIADIGHYESEQFTKNLLFDKLKEIFPTFALHLSQINTNPVNYF